MKSRGSRDVLSVFRLRKRHKKQTKFSLNNDTTLQWEGNTKINVPTRPVARQDSSPDIAHFVSGIF